MNAKKQYEEYLVWLKKRHKEVVDDYRSAPDDTQRLYRRLLLRLQSEIWFTKQDLRKLPNA